MSTKKVKQEIETLIRLSSFGPRPDTPEGEAWGRGARWGYEQAMSRSTDKKAAAKDAAKTIASMAEASIKQLFMSNFIRHNKRVELLKELSDAVATIEEGLEYIREE